jgi:hypothetical protein
MFENRTDIQPFLADTELGLFAADIARLCKPSICFEAGEDRPGGPRFGGLPDLAAVFAWPVREAYAHGLLVAERLADRGEGFASQCCRIASAAGRFRSNSIRAIPPSPRPTAS